jgi:hypothetical protein
MMIVQKQNLKELVKLTLLNILSVKGVLYTHYKNKQKQKGKTMNNWVDNRIEKVEQKDIESNEQVMELADDIFSDYVEAHPEEEDKLQFWNEKENIGNDTELGSELYEYIRNSLEDKSVVYHKNEDEYFGFVEREVA